MKHLIHLIIISSFALCASMLGALFYRIHHPTIDFTTLITTTFDQPSLVLDEEGKELFSFKRSKKSTLSSQEIPPILVKAFIAAEDHAFFSHHGISPKGIVRSFLVNIYHGGVKQGASTITQQIVKLLFLSSARSFKRKIQEFILALQIEHFLTKEQIMKMYLSTIYFGRGIYGVESACKRFWGKSISHISLPEAATLAGVAKSAHFYSPLNSPTMSLQRRNIILQSMKKLGLITEEEYAQARETELELVPQGKASTLSYPYLQELLRSSIEQMYGQAALYTKGLIIQTTINKALQDKAEKIFKHNIERLRNNIDPLLNGGLISLDVSRGAIRAFIGGYDFYESQFNRAFQAKRPLGSSFKPFMYTAALMNNIPLTTTMIDEPLELDKTGEALWKPRNWNDSFEGKMTLLRALTTSNNIITIKLLQSIGYETVMNLAAECNLTQQLLAYPSLALGIVEASAEENAAAFNIFANNGVYVAPYLIESIKDAQGKKIMQHEPSRKKVLAPLIASQMAHALSLRIKRAEKLKPLKDQLAMEAIGKTGSTNGSSSTWFVGSSPELTTSVYIGRDDNKKIGKNVFSSQTAYPIWRELYGTFTPNKKHFYYDPLLEEVSIDWITGEKAHEKTAPNNYATVLLPLERHKKVLN